MRDELQKVTQSHLDAIDEYEARLQLVKVDIPTYIFKHTYKSIYIYTYIYICIYMQFVTVDILMYIYMC